MKTAISIRSSTLAVIAVALSFALTGCDKNDTNKTGYGNTPNSGSSNTSATTNNAKTDNKMTDSKTPMPPNADNTAKNKDHEVTKTPLDQGQNSADVKLTADIRKAIMDDKAMSMNAQNCKIITQNGMVTLRGPVDTIAEKESIEAKAKAVAGVTNVDNQLEVKVK